jgi:hypothetical protein
MVWITASRLVFHKDPVCEDNNSILWVIAQSLSRPKDCISLVTLDQANPALRRRHLRLLRVARSLAASSCHKAQW